MTTEAIVPGAEGGNTTKQAAPGSNPGEANQNPGDSDLQGASDGGNPGDLDLSTLPESAQKYIKGLRGESAKYRNRAKTLETDLGARDQTLAGVRKAFGIEDKDDLTPEHFQALQNENYAADFQMAVYEKAIDHGIPKNGLDFFTFKIQKATAALEDGEELGDDDLAAIATEVKTMVGGRGVVNTSTGSGASKTNPNPNPDTGGVDLNRFVAMSTTEKSELYTRNPDLYNRLVREAKDSRRLVG